MEDFGPQLGVGLGPIVDVMNLNCSDYYFKFTSFEEIPTDVFAQQLTCIDAVRLFLLNYLIYGFFNKKSGRGSGRERGSGTACGSFTERSSFTEHSSFTERSSGTGRG